MDLTHIHLLLNHFPTIGLIIGGGLFLLSLFTKSDDLKRASLVVLLGIALISIPTYMSGNGAQDAIKSLPGVSKSLIETHEGAALWGLVFMEITGAFAWLALWQFRRLGRFPAWNLVAILLLTVMSFAVMARAANIGGEIRHEEIRASQGKAAARGTGRAATRYGAHRGFVCYRNPVDVADLRNPALHWPEPFIGRGVSGGSACSRSGARRVVRILAPFAALGRDRIRRERHHRHVVLRRNSWPVHTQCCLLLEDRAGDARRGERIVLYAFDQPWALGPGEDAPFTAKFAAASAVILWVAVMYFGSMLPFLGNAF